MRSRGESTLQRSGASAPSAADSPGGAAAGGEREEVAGGHCGGTGEGTGTAVRASAEGGAQRAPILTDRSEAYRSSGGGGGGSRNVRARGEGLEEFNNKPS